MLVPLLVAAGFVLAPETAPGREPQWRLSAPADCGDEANFVARLRAAGASAALRIEFDIDSTEAGFDGRLEIRGEDSARRLYLHADACDTLIRSTVLLLADGALPDSSEPDAGDDDRVDQGAPPAGASDGFVPPPPSAPAGRPPSRSQVMEGTPAGPSVSEPTDSPVVEPAEPPRNQGAALTGWTLAAGGGVGLQLDTAAAVRLRTEAQYAWPWLRVGLTVAGTLPRSYATDTVTLRWSRLELLPRVGIGRTWTERWSGSLGVSSSFGVEFARVDSTAVSSSTDLGVAVGADARLGLALSSRAGLEFQAAGLGVVRRTALSAQSQTLLAPGAWRGYGALNLTIRVGRD